VDKYAGGAANHTSLSIQKQYFNDTLELATSINRIHDQYSSEDYWPGALPQLVAPKAAQRYREVMYEIHNIYRSSSALTALERSIDPLREAIARMGPTIEGKAKERSTQLIDYDSYRRRLKGLKEKRENLEVTLLK
jgi:hypothetical protein